MMNQEEFLKALQERIAMLEQAEQQDILAEYAQHIEMQMQGGCSEEEAIQDFGPLDELAAEILEAYHIDPTYRASVKKTKDEETDAVLSKKVQWKNPFPGLWTRITEACNRGWTRLKQLFSRKPRKEPEQAERAEEKAASAAQRTGFGHSLKRGMSGCGQSLLRGLSRFWGSTKRLLAATWRWLKQAGKWLLWLTWNVGLVVCGIPAAAVVLASAVGLGLLLVLMSRGLPLIGVMLIVLGGLLFCGALLGIFWTLIWHRKRLHLLPSETGMMVPVQEDIRSASEEEYYES